MTAAFHTLKIMKPKRMMFIFVNYGQRTYLYEKFCIEKISGLLNVPLKIVDLRWLGEISTSVLTHPEMQVPETKMEDLWDPKKAWQRILQWWDVVRNLQLIVVGLAHAESFDLRSYINEGRREPWDVCIGIRRETPVPMKDNRPEFIEELNRVAEVSTHFGGYRVLAPLIEYDKDRVVKLGERPGVPWKWTYSCYAGAGWAGKSDEKLPVHSGICSNDKRRHIAFVQAGVPDPSIYARYPQLSERDESVKFRGHFVDKRALERWGGKGLDSRRDPRQ